MRTLYVIHHSPWSERARWALQHHELQFVERVHVPLVGELGLRRKAKTKGKASVPLLLEDDGEVIQGSLAIGEFADKRGTKPTLFPIGKEDRIRELYESLEDALRGARERYTRELVKDRQGLIEALPPLLRKLPFATFSARLGASFIVKKYDAKLGSAEDRIRAGLLKVRAATQGRKYVLDDFTFADILCASIAQVVLPVEDKYLELPPATRRLWTDTAMAKEFEDVIAWRDRIYAKHRPMAGAEAAE